MEKTYSVVYNVSPTVVFEFPCQKDGTLLPAHLDNIDKMTEAFKIINKHGTKPEIRES